MWEDVIGQENYPTSAGFELTTHELLVQEHNYSATTLIHILACKGIVVGMCGLGVLIQSHTKLVYPCVSAIMFLLSF